MFQATLDRVCIERDKYEGVIITNEKMAHGTVLSVGPGRVRGNVKDAVNGVFKEHWYPTTLKPGDRVCFTLDKGEEHVIDGKKCIIMREDDVVGVIE